MIVFSGLCSSLKKVSNFKFVNTHCGSDVPGAPRYKDRKEIDVNDIRDHIGMNHWTVFYLELYTIYTYVAHAQHPGVAHKNIMQSAFAFFGLGRSLKAQCANKFYQPKWQTCAYVQLYIQLSVYTHR